MTNQHSLFSPKARWIWDDSDRQGYHYYLAARKSFSIVNPEAPARLLVTADAYYQVWINGMPLGHGPQKSAQGSRAVDCLDLTGRLRKGSNLVEFLVLSIGVGTMTYCLGRAGLIFEILAGPRRIVSNSATQVCREPARERPTVRRWMLPCVEDVQAGASPDKWRSATVVPEAPHLYLRRVPLPRREPVYPVRCVQQDLVRLPDFSVSFRLKPALVDHEQARRAELFATPATLKLVLISRKAQTLRFTPTLGSVSWSFGGRDVITGSGWNLWNPETIQPEIQLKAGANELVGRHLRSHFEDISLAGFAEYPIETEPLWVELEDGTVRWIEPWKEANPYDLASAAEPGAGASVPRTIWDLGVVHNGWISFEAEGPVNSALLLAFFEGMEEGIPRRIQWPSGCNNALIYRLGQGRRRFESFFPYGVRYIAVHEIGGSIQVRDLHLVKATCIRTPCGNFHSSDPILDGIYRMAVQCVESGTDDTMTDCPTYEQVNWNFDNRLASWAAMAAGDNREVVRNSILLFAEDPTRTGLVGSQTPGMWTQPIPLYASHWIQWCWDYYWQTADQAFVRQVFPAVAEGIREALGQRDASGLVSWPGAWHFIEWAHGRDDNHAVNTAEQAGFFQALHAAARLAQCLGKSGMMYLRAAQELKASVNRHLFNQKTGWYADSRHGDGTLSPISTQATNALVAASGLADKNWSRRLAGQLADGSCPLPPFGSPYGLFYIIDLLDRYGEGKAIFRQVQKRWGDMVRAGDGTTWEHFQEFGHNGWPTRSRCHPFSAYVLKYFVKYLLGIEATEPGFAAVQIRPHAIDKLSFCQGSIFTPQGILSVENRFQGGKKDVLVSLPPGTRLVGQKNRSSKISLKN